MTHDELLRRATALELETWQALHELLDYEPGTAAIVATEVLDTKRARAVLRAARAAGFTAIAGADEVLSNAYAIPMPPREVALPAPIATAPLEAALAKLGELAGRDPMTVLHRIPIGDVAMLESDDVDLEMFDEDSLLPDDIAEAWRVQRAARDELIASAFGGFVMTQPSRSPSVEIALDEIGFGACRVAIVDATPAQALRHLQFGAFNACPRPEVHALVWERWAERFGAEPVLVTEDRIAGVIARPITTREALVELAAEVAAYDPDLAVEGWLTLLATLYRNASFDFWWD